MTVYGLIGGVVGGWYMGNQPIKAQMRASFISKSVVTWPILLFTGLGMRISSWLDKQR